MNELKIFNSEEFGSVRTVEIEGEVWFIGKDVAEALGYKNTKDALGTHVTEEDKRNIQRSEIATLENHIPKETLNVNFVSADIPNRGLTAINESGLYSLIFGSKLESAKRFKKWITSEVLPSIRKTGMYAMNDLSPELRLLISMEMKQKQQEKEMLSMKADMKRLEAKVTTHNDDYYTIAGYASLRGLNVDISRANMLGRKASKLSKEYGYETAKTKDSRFGTVNTYHSDVLKEVFRYAV